MAITGRQAGAKRRLRSIYQNDKIAPIVMIRLVVLIPHMEIRALIEAQRLAFFARGVLGAFSFPPFAPLAELRRPLSFAELKHAARSLRLKTAANGKSPPLRPLAPRFLELPGLGVIYGHALSAPPVTLPQDAVKLVFSGTALAAAFIEDGLSRAFSPPRFSLPPFTSAALANMVIRSFSSGAFFEWATGRPAWLPR
jgi:hypothetical protein